MRSLKKIDSFLKNLGFTKKNYSNQVKIQPAMQTGRKKSCANFGRDFLGESWDKVIKLSDECIDLAYSSTWNENSDFVKECEEMRINSNAFSPIIFERRSWDSNEASRPALTCASTALAHTILLYLKSIAVRRIHLVWQDSSMDPWN